MALQIQMGLSHVEGRLAMKVKNSDSLKITLVIHALYNLSGLYLKVKFINVLIS